MSTPRPCRPHRGLTGASRGGRGGPGRVFCPARDTGFPTSTPGWACTSKLCIQHPETKRKAKRCGTGPGLKTLLSTRPHTYFSAAKTSLFPFPRTHAPLHPRPQEVSMRKTIILICFALFCIKMNKRQSRSKPAPHTRRLFNRRTHHHFPRPGEAARKCLALRKLKAPATVVRPWIRHTGRRFVPWFLQCIKGDNGIFSGYEESLTLVCMKLFEMHEGHYSV